MDAYKMTIAGCERELPLCRVNDEWLRVELLDVRVCVREEEHPAAV